MKPDEELLSFLDLLDLDEEIIDLRIKSIIQKSSFSHENLSNLLYLLQYKHLINMKEDSECENEQEFTIVNNLLANMTDMNVDFTSKIVYTILILNPSSIVYKAEHLFQQVIANMYIPNNIITVANTNDTEYDMLNSTFLQLKICQSVLDAVISCKPKLSLPFLDSPIERLVCTKHEPLNTFFLTRMIPLIFEGISGFHILDRIWNLIKLLKQSDYSLKVLCSLSNYYLPMPHESIYESEVISYSEFWDIIFYGLSSDSSKNRKFSMYLIKRAIDCLMPVKKDVHINSKCTFTWTYDKREKMRNLWNDFFVLMDSLDEKQSNIVLPALILINTVKEIGYCWLNCAFNIGLNHDNNQVRFKCIHYRLDYPINNSDEAVTLLEAINDTNLFGEENQQTFLENKMKIALESYDNLNIILKTMPLIKWAPVSLFYMTRILKDLSVTVINKNSQDDLPNILQSLLKLPCTNIVIRKSIYLNLSLFIKKCRLQWRDYINICACFPKEINLNIIESDKTHSSFIMTDLIVPAEENKHFLELVNSYVNIDCALIYFSGRDSKDFKDILNIKLNNIKNISERQYSQKSECISDAIFITEFYRRIQGCSLEEKYIDISYNISNVILNYVKSLLSSDANLEIDDLNILFEGLNIMFADCTSGNKEILLQLLTSSLLVLKDVNVELNKRVLNILTLNCLLKCPLIVNHHLPQSEVVTTILKGLQFSNKESNESIGRLKNMFYEKSSEIFYLLIKNNNSLPVNSDILNFVDHIMDSGGYGCLNWILQIMNRITPHIVQGNNNYDISKFLSKAWREIEELKTNSQYSICIKEFITLLLHDDLLKNAMYNNIIVMYCSKIIEYGSVKSLPLYYLVNEMNSKNISASSHIIYIFCDILLYSVVLKKENRILEDVTEEILRDTQYMICKTKDFHFTSHIKYLSVHALSKITEPEILNTIADFIIRRVDEIFKNKQRYHGNSQIHKTVQAAIQNLLFMTLKTRLINVEKIGIWCMDLLGKLPHQQFVRTCLEWFIALYIYIKNRELNNDVLKQLQSKNVPITSQFLILYFVLVRKIKSNVCSIEEYRFVLDTYLSHTMGPTYSVRLYAQYLAYRIKESSAKFDLIKYNLILEVIEQTLKNASAEKDKSYQKLLNDYFVHKFDIVEDLTPWHVYHYLPMSDNFNENVDVEFFNDRIDKIYKCVDEGKDSFYDEWQSCRKNREYSDNFEPYDNVNKHTESSEVGTIQKKYVPWKSMSDVGICGTEEKGNKSDLIVVASLIDRLPNLGGMARTSEVFGVLTYVVDSLRHLQDKQFQGLSVSAERWINVEEVRPGKPLKDYLMMKKSEGYSIVAAEQTSSSTPLQTFKFPKKTLLLLGHEKEGVPCDFLPLMDACVEIPQQGVIRSLNVHVTAAIFVWEYARQIML